MKVIDILNKIANGEEVPKKIEYIGLIYEYDEKIKDYFNDNLWLFYSMNSIGLIEREVEIIEDTSKKNTKIEKLSNVTIYGATISALRNELQATNKRFEYKINEIIYKINGEENDN